MLPERQEKSFFAECVSFNLNRNDFLQNILKEKYSNSSVLFWYLMAFWKNGYLKDKCMFITLN